MRLRCGRAEKRWPLVAPLRQRSSMTHTCAKGEPQDFSSHTKFVCICLAVSDSARAHEPKKARISRATAAAGGICVHRAPATRTSARAYERQNRILFMRPARERDDFVFWATHAPTGLIQLVRASARCARALTGHAPT